MLIETCQLWGFKRRLRAGVTEKAQAIVHWNKYSSVREFPVPITLPGLLLTAFMYVRGIKE